MAEISIFPCIIVNWKKVGFKLKESRASIRAVILMAVLIPLFSNLHSTCLFVLPLSETAAKTMCSCVVVVGQFLLVRFQVADMSDIYRQISWQTRGQRTRPYTRLLLHCIALAISIHDAYNWVQIFFFQSLPFLGSDHTHWRHPPRYF